MPMRWYGTNAPGQWDRDSLVTDVLKRDEERYWWSGFSGDIHEKDRYRALAAIVTLCGGLKKDEVERLVRQV